MRLTPLIAAAALLLLAGGCPSKTRTPTPTPGTAGYSDAARSVYEAAQRALKGGEYAYATRRFQEVRSKFPYSDYAPLAEIGLADTMFAEGKHLEAAEAYRAFVKARPTHEKADYAAYREAESLQEEAPSDFFLFPPNYEKDLSEVRENIRVLRSFLVTYPDSEHRKDAQSLLDDNLRTLAQHELYVAEFYRRKQKWRGVAFRLEALLDSYPGLGFDGRAKVGLAEAYLRGKTPRPDDARRLLDEVVASDADDGLKARARALQAELSRRRPSAEPAAASEHEGDSTASVGLDPSTDAR